MVQPGATKDSALSCSSKATGSPQAFSSRNTLQVVAVASRPLPGMTSCLAPSPAVMSSLDITVTRSGLPAIRWIRLVLPSVTSAPSLCLGVSAVRASTTGSCLWLTLVACDAWVARDDSRYRILPGGNRCHLQAGPKGLFGRRRGLVEELQQPPGRRLFGLA